jgi:hypothetical protein
MNESYFLQKLKESPGDVSLLREYAAWLHDRGDARAQQLIAELDFYDAENHFKQAEQLLGRLRGSRPQDFDWLNSILPMFTYAPASGVFYNAPSPDDAAFVQLGDFCSRDTVVGIIEAQKIFFQIPAGHNGIIIEVYVSNRSAVTAGDALFKLMRPQKEDAVNARFRR